MYGFNLSSLSAAASRVSSVLQKAKRAKFSARTWLGLE